MKTHPECYACFINQALKTAKFLTGNYSDLINIAKDCVRILENIDNNMPPPLISKLIYKSVQERLNVNDPYKNIKDKYNKIAKNYSNYLEHKIALSKEPLMDAIKASLSGNIIDFGSEIDDINIKASIETTFSMNLNKDTYLEFENKLSYAKNLVLIADNAGEIVFDKILLKTIKNIYNKIDITLIVRGHPIINDITRDDIKDMGLENIGDVVSSNEAMPGLWPKKCLKKCKDAFNNADIIVSKGQGNLETLSELKDERIYFLFMVKCGVVSNLLSLNKLSKVFTKNNKKLWEKLQA